MTAVLTVGGAAAATAAFVKVDGLTATGALSHIAMLTAQTIDDEPDKSPKYVPSPKHDKSMPDRGRQGTPMDLSDEQAQEVLDRSIEDGKQRYGTKDGKIYVFQPDNTGGYHGYPEENTQTLPPKILRDLRDRGDLTNSQYNKLVKGK